MPRPSVAEIPCLMAFSTMGWMLMAGMRKRPAPGVDIELQSQPLAEAGLLDAQVRGDEIHLLGQVRPLAPRLAQRVPEDVRRCSMVSSARSGR